MPLKTQQDQSPSLNLTPMIDVLFLLIIFFMVGTKFTEIEPNLPVELPQVAEARVDELPPKRRTIRILADGTVQLDSRTVTNEDLTEQLQADIQRRPDLGVVVRSDASGPFQNVAQVLSACQSAGVQRVAVAVELDTTRR